jgi:hypothetical protein
VASIVESGRLLTLANRVLGYGRWGEYVRDAELPYGEREAEMLIRIASNAALADPGNHHNLPISMHCLYVLSGVGPEGIERGLRSGRFTFGCRSPKPRGSPKRTRLPSATDDLEEAAGRVLRNAGWSRQVRRHLGRVWENEKNALADLTSSGRPAGDLDAGAGQGCPLGLESGKSACLCNPIAERWLTKIRRTAPFGEPHCCTRRRLRRVPRRLERGAPKVSP